MTSISSITSPSSSLQAARAAHHSKMQERLFSKVDADQSGGVDAAELQTLVDDMSARAGVSIDTSTSPLWSQADGNGDGTLDADELGQVMQSLLPEPPSTMAFARSRGGSDDTDDLFSQVDTDQDGSLSPEEFAAGRPADRSGDGAAVQGPPPPSGVPGSHSADSSTATDDPLDTNEDGVVSLAERLAGASQSDPLQALLQAIDTDQDGQLSRSEADSFLQQLKTPLESVGQYEQVAAGTSSQSVGSTLHTTA